MNPAFSYCDGFFFTAYDPPIALTTVSALAPPVPPHDPKSHPWASGTTISSHTPGPKSDETHHTKVSVPRPAGTPTVYQPTATMNANRAKKVESKSDPRTSDSASQEGLPSQLPSKTMQRNSNPIAGSSLQQANNPEQGNNRESHSNNTPQKGSDSDPAGDSNHSGDPRPDGNSKPMQDSDPNQANDHTPPWQGSDLTQSNDPGSSSGLTQGTDPNQSGDLKSTQHKAPPQSYESYQASDSPSQSTNTLNRLTEGFRSKDPETAPATAGSALNAEASDVTIDGTLISHNTIGQLPSGSKSIALDGATIDSSRPSTEEYDSTNSRTATSITSQTIAPNSTAEVLTFSSTTPDLGSPDLTFNKTIVPVNIAAKSASGTKTVSLERSNNGTAGLRGPTTGALQTGGLSRTTWPSSVQGDLSRKGVGSTTGTTSVQAFAGEAASLKGRSVWFGMVVVVFAISVSGFL